MKAVFANQDLAITNKYSNQVATYTALADAKVIDQAHCSSTSLPTFIKQNGTL